MPKRLRVAIVDEEFPFPANSGKRIRTLNLISRLATTHELTYVAYSNPDREELERAVAHLKSLGIRTIEIPKRIQPKSGSAFYLKLAANLFSRLPYSVTSHVSREMLSQISRMHASGEVQLWHCEWTPCLELFRNLNATPLVMAAHNVESLIWKRYYEVETNYFKRWYILQQWKKFQRFERWAFERAEVTITVSDEDARLSQREFGAQNPQVVENGVDVQQYASTGKSRSPFEMIFLGSLDWRPNLDGILKFLDSAFPRIVAARPEAHLHIVGRNPPEWLIQRVKSEAQVKLSANVPDVVTLLSCAGVMVVPLRVGGGSRLKIIEAAANGLPVVSTRIGAEGLAFRHGRDFFLSEDIDSMDRPILELMENAQLAQQAVSHARAIAEQRYNWDILAKRQAAIWESIVS